MTNADVTKLGGNQYKVVINLPVTEAVDLDGYTVIKNDDYEKLDEAGLLEGDIADRMNFISPASAEGVDPDDKHFIAAVEYAANYSGFDVDQYISENKK